MKKIVWTMMCCAICMSITACTKEEGSEEAATARETEAATAQETEAAEEVAIIGTWQITEWKVDDIDQMELWGVADFMVDFRDDGSMETKLVYDSGDVRTSPGTWKTNGDMVEITVTGGGEEGDEPFERTRDYMIDELTARAFVAHGEIQPAGEPIVLTFRGERVAEE